jgi:UDP:flavonoid glycosyltransferase YjiC (YdhE family)
VPFAFDQSDNAEHARRLGTSRTVYRNKYQAARVANELHKLLSQPAYKQNAIQVSEQLKQENGPKRAAELIEQVFGGTRTRDEELIYAAGD